MTRALHEHRHALRLALNHLSIDTQWLTGAREVRVDEEVAEACFGDKLLDSRALPRSYVGQGLPAATWTVRALGDPASHRIAPENASVLGEA